MTGVEAANLERDARQQVDDTQATVRVGKVNFRMAAGLRQEYNDNIGLTPKAREHDFITTPHLTLGAHWPISQLNSLDLVLGLAYSKYWEHPALDTTGLLIEPTSMLDFNVYVGDVRINVHDRIGIQQDPISAGQLSNITTFRRLNNTAGIAADWDLNKVILTGGYDYSIFRTLEDGYSYLDQDSHEFYGRIGYRYAPQLTLGLQGSYIITDYLENVQNDGTTWSAGVYADTIFSEYLRGGASVSFQGSRFDSNGTIGDTSSFNSVVFTATLNNQLNRWLNHSLTLRRFTTLGIGTNFTETYRVDYSLNAEVVEQVTTSLNFFHEWFRDSSSAGTGYLAQKGMRWGVGPMIGYQITPASRLSIGYQRTERDANYNLYDYTQNVAFIDFNHQF
ncbi:MAG: hypothetical protein IT578_03105 [Verrucomicrobiae bacterium]|nr:hypothetical protein [Verrucomicrobiae bacterium]